eukprot:4775351-Prymnesium_polylepis.2
MCDARARRAPGPRVDAACGANLAGRNGTARAHTTHSVSASAPLLSTGAISFWLQSSSSATWHAHCTDASA